MRWGGVLLLAFIVFHILHFTMGVVDPAGQFAATTAAGQRDVYRNIVGSFRVPWVAAFYVVAMAFLGLHLFHGAWSAVRTLGFTRPSGEPLHRSVALVIALGAWLGFTLVPLGVMTGVIR